MWISQVRNFIAGVVKWLTHVVREPRDELDRWQRAVRFSYDLGKYGAKQLREDRAPQMAAALAYQSLFALVPVLVVALILVRATISEDKLNTHIGTLLTTAGLNTASIELPSDFGDPNAPIATISLQEWLLGLVGTAESVEITAFSGVGAVLIIYAAINLLVTIERSFNSIYRAPEGRAWVYRGPLYWSMLTVGPFALILMAYLNGGVEAWAKEIAWGPWFEFLVTMLWSLAVGWLFWFAVYTLVPNTSVDARASAVGALICVILMEIGKQSLGASLSRAFAVNQLFGSLGSIPLFMLWVYLMWLAVLFGLEVSATLQFLGDRALEEMETRRMLSGLIEPAAVVGVMEVIAREFREGRSVSERKIVDMTGIPEQYAELILQELCTAGMLHRVDRDNAVCLAQPPDQLTVDRLMEIGFQLADAGGERRIGAFAAKLREGQRTLARQFTLSGIVAAD